jgi:hypothetical protein
MKSRKFLSYLLVISIFALLASCASNPTIPRASMAMESKNRMVSYSASIRFEVKDVASAKETFIKKCEEVNGFVTRESNNDLVLRIPVGEYGNYINAIKGAGKITESDIYGEDITDYYEDIVLTLESKKVVRATYTALLEKTVKVEEILAIEKELERINLEIQLLEGKVAEANKKVAFVTLSISIHEKVTPGPIGWVFYLLYKGIEWLFVWD